MSESNEHRELVMLMAWKLQARHSNVLVEIDAQMHPGETVPRIINGRRPDIFAYTKDAKFFVIGEAKTVAGLDNKHTYTQMASFVGYLEAMHQGTFVLGISGEKANSAKTMLRFLRKELSLTKTSLQVFDGCDFWTLDKREGVLWHLGYENLQD